MHWSPRQPLGNHSNEQKKIIVETIKCRSMTFGIFTSCIQTKNVLIQFMTLVDLLFMCNLKQYKN